MTRTRRVRVTRRALWRWRRNPLRRHSDVVEAWIVLAVWTVALLGGLFAGGAAGAAVHRSFADRRAATHPVSARLTENAVGGTPAGGGSPVLAGYDVGKSWVTVRWTAADGSTRTGLAKALPTAKAGSRLQVWVNHGEQLVGPPPSGAEVACESLATAVLVAPLVATVVWGGGWVVRRQLIRRRLAEWDAEWRQIGPQWRNFSGGKG
ncbi:hypothetical protein [Streptomyces sp. GbtcB6]|uniref:Rv1733c family protein n=1 Tax=Streptomyces sp. GbtcB6 TaxID=2824751 RepID=UPI001C2F522D|nr:hypothetical protein [Streptomyces sp. GbtcB6]